MPRYNFFLRRLIGFFFILLTAIHPACYRSFYKVAEEPTTATGENISRMQDANRYFVLRSKYDARRMRDVTLSGDQKNLHYTLDSLPQEHSLHLRRGHRNGNLQYKRQSPERQVLNEVHLFVRDHNLPPNGTFTMPLDSIARMEVIQKDGGRTAVNYVFSSIGVAAGIFAAVGLIAVMTSCPFVSGNDGNEYVLQGELYAGAVYPQLSRKDYLPLQLKPVNGQLSIRISNDLKEHQHIDVAKLITIEHPNDLRIMNDEYGRYYSVSDPMPLVSAMAGSRNVEDELSEKDFRFYSFDDSLAAPEDNSIVMKFKKPSGAKKAKLILSLKNTFWLDKVYSRMSAGFGNYYSTFVANQHKQPADVLQKWITEQKISLQVSLRDNANWKEMSSVTTIGPLANRDLIVPIEIPITSDNYIEIKLSSGFHFWDVDYAAIDYSVDNAFTVHEATPVKATTIDGEDVKPALSDADGVFNHQLFTGATTTLFYNHHVPAEGNTNTYFLLSKGYYEPVRDYSGKPDVAFLKQFRQPGALARYSAQIYKQEKSAERTATANKN